LKHYAKIGEIEGTILNYQAKLVGAAKNALIRLLTKLYILSDAIFSLQDANILYNFLEDILVKAKTVQ
jgi:hypothetical protein